MRQWIMTKMKGVVLSFTKTIHIHTFSCALGQFAGIDPAMEPSNVGTSHSTAWIDDDGLILLLELFFFLEVSNGADDAMHMEINDNTCGSILSPKEVVDATPPPSKMAVR